MLQYKSVSVERLICTCDRCGAAIDKQANMMEWQERFALSFRAGYGSVFGDGNLVEGDFCQECIQATLGKWLRVSEDDPFEPKHKPSTEPEKILQTYQHERKLQAEESINELTTLFKQGSVLVEKRKQIAEHFGIPENQVSEVAYDYLLRSLNSDHDNQINLASVQNAVPSAS